MKIFKLYWSIKDKDGNQETEIIHGTDTADAFRNAGYGGGAIRALDYYEEIKE